MSAVIKNVKCPGCESIIAVRVSEANEGVFILASNPFYFEMVIKFRDFRPKTPHTNLNKSHRILHIS